MVEQSLDSKITFGGPMAQLLSDGEPRKLVHHYDKIIEKHAELKWLPAGSDRAREVHRQIYKAGSKFDKKVSCKRGCFHCCRDGCLVTSDEADLIVEEYGHQRS